MHEKLLSNLLSVTLIQFSQFENMQSFYLNSQHYVYVLDLVAHS